MPTASQLALEIRITAIALVVVLATSQLWRGERAKFKFERYTYRCWNRHWHIG